MTTVRLSKLQATGNDFLVVSWLHAHAGVSGIFAPQAAALCDRHRGVGADGLIVVLPGSDGADAEMLLYNADGGIAEMSGNGIRALAWVAAREGLGRNGTLAVDTGGGRRVVELTVLPGRGEGGEVVAATVDMGPVTFDPQRIPLAAESPFGLTADYHGTHYEGDAAGMGNPHLVLFVDDPATARVTQHGPHLEHDDRFPRRTNVEFVRPTPGATDEIDMRVWERGVGETLSCGTGACAVAAVAHRRGLVGERAVVHVPGGDLVVELGDTIRLGGPVVHVFDVEVELPPVPQS
ncbi:MAG: diaminopimelate epimerase [Actinomycetota bacterium]|nr:diaminopimelate epimerase [Actinomycetota bacterium]